VQHTFTNVLAVQCNLSRSKIPRTFPLHNLQLLFLDSFEHPSNPWCHRTVGAKRPWGDVWATLNVTVSAAVLLCQCCEALQRRRQNGRPRLARGFPEECQRDQRASSFQEALFIGIKVAEPPLMWLWCSNLMILLGYIRTSQHCSDVYKVAKFLLRGCYLSLHSIAVR
jgi:hypothetical protein